MRPEMLYCYRCGNVWNRVGAEKPKLCPRCKSSRWDEAIPKDVVCPECGTGWTRTQVDEPCPGCGWREGCPPELGILHCNQCDHNWVPRTPGLPKRCPLCRSKEWDGPRASQHTCFRCGHVWKNRSSRPTRCPRCHSEKWDVPAYRLQCRRCGYRWTSRGNRPSDEVAMCPSCKSRRWNEAPELQRCCSCGSYYIAKGGGQDPRCPACRSQRLQVTCRCGFCGMSWTQQDAGWSTCPGCGKPRSDGIEESALEIWTDGDRSLRYIHSDGIGLVYLWHGREPVATMYFHDLLAKTGLTADQFKNRLQDGGMDETLAFVADDLHRGRDGYLRYVPYFMKRLGLKEFDATVLAIHFTGMGPEAIAIRFQVSLDDVRKSFDRIMAAYVDSGIVVNDSIFTEDPFSFY